MRLWVARPEPDAARTAERLSARGHVPLVAPLMRTELLPFALPPDPQALLLTSRNAVRALQAAAVPAGWRKLPVFAVGDGTAAAARDAGFAEVHSARGTGADLAVLVAASLPASGGAFFYPAAEKRSPRVEADLAAAGYDVETAIAYRMVPEPELPPAAAQALRRGDLDGIVLTSPRLAATCRDLVLKADLAMALGGVHAYVLSEAVAAQLADLPFAGVDTAERPDEESLMALVGDAET